MKHAFVVELRGRMKLIPNNRGRPRDRLATMDRIPPRTRTSCGSYRTHPTAGPKTIRDNLTEIILRKYLCARKAGDLAFRGGTQTSYDTSSSLQRLAVKCLYRL
jgi:hypothetical protein